MAGVAALRLLVTMSPGWGLADMALSNRRFIGAALVLVLLVLTVYGQTARHSFLSYDDSLYLTNNPAVTGGLTAEGFRWAFGFHVGNWHPLTWLSHQLDWELFGPRAGQHHVVGAAIHALNAVMVLILFHGMTGALWRSTAVAGIFALHPLRVESVAWAAERKDLLSACLQLLAMLAWSGWVRRRTVGRYLTCLGLFALALMAKPMPLTLPLILLFLDWWPLGRLATPRTSNETASPAGQLPPAALILEKLPLAVLAAASALVTIKAQTTGIVPMVIASFPTRLANALVSYAVYMGDFVWPSGLGIFYPYPREIAVWKWGGAAILLGAVTVTVLRQARRRPYLTVGFLWYLVAMIPVIGLVQVGGQARADRYTYLSLLGVTAALVWLADDLWPSTAVPRRVLLLTTGLVVAILTAASTVQVSRWRDEISIFQHTARVTTNNAVALTNLGVALDEAGRTDEADRVLDEAVRIDPRHCNAPYNLGIVQAKRGSYHEALASSLRALECYREAGFWQEYVADTHLNIARIYLQLGQPSQAARHLRQLLAISPGNTAARHLLDLVLKTPSGMPRS